MNIGLAESIPLTDLILDSRLQCRATIDMALIDEYAENVLDLPPGKAVRVGSVIYLTDGWHTHGGHAKAGAANMACIVRDGTFEDALIEAAGANHEHGRRRTSEDKRRAVEMILKEMPSKKDNEVARYCKVSNHFVAKVRSDSKPQAQRTTSVPENMERSTAQKCQSCARKIRVGQSVPTRCKDCEAVRKAKPPTTPAQATEEAEQPTPLCERCKGLGNRVGSCTACLELEANPPKPAPPAPPVKDDAGTVVPMWLIPVFEMRETFDLAAKQLNACSKTFQAIEEGPTKAAKPLVGKCPACNGEGRHDGLKDRPVCRKCKGTGKTDPPHFVKFYPTFKSARARLKAMRPALVCPECAGEGCKWCGTLGWLTREAADA